MKIKQHNSMWSYTPGHPILITGGSGSVLLNLLSNQPDIDKIFVCKRSLQSKISIFN